MGKLMKKCKGIGEFTVMEVSSTNPSPRVRTRARTLAPASGNRKKVVSGELPISYLQLRSRRLVIFQEKRNSTAKSGNLKDRSTSSEEIAASRCSSYGSSEMLKKGLGSGDLEDEGFENPTYNQSREREATPSSTYRGDSDPTARINSERKSTDVITPSKAEIEEFFSKVESDEQKRFSKEYNFDVVKEVPLEGGGRFEWVKLK